MKFSLIIGTLDRTEAIELCLKSIFEQTWQDYEIIIIDQSSNKLTENYVNTLEDKRIKYKHVYYKGLSKARNDALKIAEADYFCLIDDDAYYDKEYLYTTNAEMTDKRTILSGFIYDTVNQKPFAQYDKKSKRRKLGVRSIMKICPSAALVFPMCVRDEVGFFDEQLGIGTRYGAGEESDLIIRCLERGYKVNYISQMKLMHPVPVTSRIRNCSDDKLASYYKGIGALYKKHLIDGKKSCLRSCYLEIWIKLILKRCFIFKYDSVKIKKIIYAFKEGINDYKCIG